MFQRSSKVHQYFLYTIVIFSLLLLSFGSNIPTSYSIGEKVIRVDLSQFKFEPGRIIVNRGDTVIFKLRSKDVTHGFYIDGYNVDEVVKPGEIITVSLTVNEPGKFKIRCSVTCGPLHPFMVGDLLVYDNGLNIPFIGAFGFIILLSVFAVVRQLRGEMIE